MASKELLKQYKIIIQGLAQKYEVSPGKVETILGKLDNKELGSLDWKDLDAVVQEGLEDDMPDHGRSTDSDTRYLD